MRVEVRTWSSVAPPSSPSVMCAAVETSLRCLAHERSLARRSSHCSGTAAPSSGRPNRAPAYNLRRSTSHGSARAGPTAAAQRKQGRFLEPPRGRRTRIVLESLHCRDCFEREELP